MLILSRVCADFRDATGAVIYRVTPSTRLTFREAPEAIRGDPLFRMLLDDGSLEVASSVVTRRNLEADPMKDADASGKRVSRRRAAAKTDARKEREPAGSPGSENDSGGPKAGEAPAADAAGASPN